MGANFYSKGQWNFFCDLCGAKEKSGNGVKTWDNFYVCKWHKEVRNPQDFLKGVKDDQTVPWARPEATDHFLTYCTMQSSSAIPKYAVPGCMIPGNNNTAFVPTLQSGNYY